MTTLTKEEYDELLAAHIELLKADGYRFPPQRDKTKLATVEQMIEELDIYAHNIAISLRSAYELSKSDPATHAAVETLYHTIMAESGHAYRWLKGHNEKEHGA